MFLKRLEMIGSWMFGLSKAGMTKELKVEGV